ncbi:hypothetical protein AB0M39_42005 [Streptomyces sp. NPDC051907]|uniref:hypothetical protein n=1 Tax=Streptomyces sp. NPDC051907 TaxID=3155284 RepID=UPI003413DA36
MITFLVRKIASGLTELLARALRDCGREVVVEHLHVHLHLMRVFGISDGTAMRYITAVHPERTTKLPH